MSTKKLRKKERKKERRKKETKKKEKRIESKKEGKKETELRNRRNSHNWEWKKERKERKKKERNIIKKQRELLQLGMLIPLGIPDPANVRTSSDVKSGLKNRFFSNVFGHGS